MEETCIELYKNHKSVRDYVKRYIRETDMTVEEACKEAIVITVSKWIVENENEQN